MALLTAQIGKTFTTTSGNLEIFGAPFNPYLVSGSLTGITNLASSFDLSGLQYGHEVIGALGTWDESGGHYIEFRKSSTSLFSSYFSGYPAMGAYIGIDYDEIMSNGSDYYADFGIMTSSSDEGYYDYVSGSNSINFGSLSPIFYAAITAGDILSISFYDWDGGSGITFNSTGTYLVDSKSSNNVYFSTNVPQSTNGFALLCLAYKGKTLQTSVNFSITNMPAVTEATSGYIWVEGDNLCFIGAEKTSTGYKHIIKNDGTVYSSGKTPGMYWVDQVNHGKLGYIDSSGNERKTHQGDIHGRQGGNETSLSGKTPGYIWVSGTSGNYGYMTFIAYDGNGYRIMNGQY